MIRGRVTDDKRAFTPRRDMLEPNFPGNLGADNK